MGPHSVTCHPTQVNMPHLNPRQIGRYSIYYPVRMEGWVDLVGLSPIAVLSRPSVQATIISRWDVPWFPKIAVTIDNFVFNPDHRMTQLVQQSVSQSLYNVQNTRPRHLFKYNLTASYPLEMQQVNGTFHNTKLGNICLNSSIIISSAQVKILQ